jgi:hypothetical protein
MYHSILALAIGASAVAVISDTIVIGQVDICDEEPKRPAIITGINAVYRPTCIGSPANPAYAIDCGTNTKATVIPAIISFFTT